MKMNVEGKGRKRKAKKEMDGFELRLTMTLRAVGECVGDVENRDEWRIRTKVSDPE